MRDYNFFTLIKRSKKHRLKGKKAPNSYIFILIVVGLLAIIAWPGIIQARLIYLDNQISKYNQELIQDPKYNLFKEVDQKQKELSNIQNTVSKLKQVSNDISEKEVVNEKLLNLITTTLPSDTNLTKLTISEQSVNMSGVARSRAAIAELLYNLRNTGKFKLPFITSLSENNNLYPFSLSLEIIGGGIK